MTEAVMMVLTVGAILTSAVAVVTLSQATQRLSELNEAAQRMLMASNRQLANHALDAQRQAMAKTLREFDAPSKDRAVAEVLTNATGPTDITRKPVARRDDDMME